MRQHNARMGINSLWFFVVVASVIICTWRDIHVWLCSCFCCMIVLVARINRVLHIFWAMWCGDHGFTADQNHKTTGFLCVLFLPICGGLIACAFAAQQTPQSYHLSRSCGLCAQWRRSRSVPGIFECQRCDLCSVHCCRLLRVRAVCGQWWRPTTTKHTATTTANARSQIHTMCSINVNTLALGIDLYNHLNVAHNTNEQQRALRYPNVILAMCLCQPPLIYLYIHILYILQYISDYLQRWSVWCSSSLNICIFQLKHAHHFASYYIQAIRMSNSCKRHV